MDLVTRYVYYLFTVHIFKPSSFITQFPFTKYFINKFLNTILKLTGAYILLLKKTKGT